MIKHSILIFLLLMFLSIDPSFGGVSIDTERCFTDTVCLAPRSCVTSTGSDDLQQYSGRDKDLPFSPNCSVLLQIKPYTENKYLVKMQVTSDNNALDKKRGLTLLYDSMTVSFCNESLSNWTSFPPSQFISKPAGSNSVSESIIKCSQFIVAPTADIAGYFRNMNKIKLVFGYIDGTTQEYQSNDGAINIMSIVVLSIGCDPDKVYSSKIDQPADVNLTMIDDTTRHSFDCSNLTGHSTYIKLDGKQLEQVTDLKCEKKKFSYKNSLNVTVDIPDTFSVYCGVPVCSMCTDIPEYNENCTACSTPEFINSTTPGSCVSLTCPDNRWIYNNGTTITKAPECKRSNSTKGGYAWTMNQNGHDIEMKKGACSQQYDCATANPLKSECNSTVGLCAVVRIKHPIKCTDSSSKMKVSSNKTLAPKKITCDANTGNWYADGKKNWTMIPKGTNVYCEPDKNATASSKSASSTEETDYTVYIYIATGGGLLLLLLIIGGIVGFILYRRRNKKIAERNEELLRNEEKRRKMEERKRKEEEIRRKEEETKRKEEETKRKEEEEKRKEEEEKRKQEEKNHKFDQQKHQEAEKKFAADKEKLEQDHKKAAAEQKKAADAEKQKLVKEKIEMETKMRTEISNLVTQIQAKNKECELLLNTPEERNIRVRPDPTNGLPSIADIEATKLRAVGVQVKNWMRYSVYERFSFLKKLIYVANEDQYSRLLAAVGKIEFEPRVWVYLLEGALNLLRLVKDLSATKYDVDGMSEEIHPTIYDVAVDLGGILKNKYRLAQTEGGSQAPAAPYMRYIMARLLHYVEHADFIKELEELNDPVSGPIRIVAWAHAARQMPLPEEDKEDKPPGYKPDPAEEKKLEEKKAERKKLNEENAARYQALFAKLTQPAPQDDKPDELGTYHQHVIRALAIAAPKKSGQVIAKILEEKSLATKENLQVFFRSLVDATARGDIPVKLFDKHMTAILAIVPKDSPELFDIMDNAGRCCLEDDDYYRIEEIRKKSTCPDLLPNLIMCKGLYLNYSIMRGTVYQALRKEEMFNPAMGC